MDLFQHAALAERLRDAGMARASEAQDRAMPAWNEMAYRAIVAVAKTQGDVHVDDVLRVFRDPADHPNAWGSVWMRAVRDGVIERTNRVRPSFDPAKHKHQYPIYRSNIFRSA